MEESHFLGEDKDWVTHHHICLVMELEEEMILGEYGLQVWVTGVLGVVHLGWGLAITWVGSVASMEGDQWDHCFV